MSHEIHEITVQESEEPAKILVVDDNEVILDLIRTILEYDGHSVICCDDPRDVGSILNKYLLRVCITDYNMPYKTGDQVADEVKHKDPRIIVLMCSAIVNGNRDRFDALQREGRIYGSIAKPFSVKVLSQMVNDALNPSLQVVV